MSSVQMMFKFKSNHKKLVLALALCGILVVCYWVCSHIGNPLIRLNVQDATANGVDCVWNFQTVTLTQEQKEDAIKASDKLKLNWFPSAVNFTSIKDFPQEYDTHISLVFPEQMAVSIFQLSDGNLIVFVNSWNNEHSYQAKNPECMFSFIRNLINQ